MELPQRGEEYLYNSDFYPQITDIKVKVIQSKENFILLNVIDDEFLDEELYNAKKHQKEYNDWENTSELYPFVSRKNNRIVKDSEICIFSLDKFHKKCKKL